MSAVARTHHIKRNPRSISYHFHFKRSTPRRVLTEIASRYSSYLAIEPEDELVDITTTDWYKEMEKKMKPSDYLRHLREAHGLTQKALGEAVGTNAAHISDYETGQRTISKEMAKKLARLFKISTDVFI